MVLVVGVQNSGSWDIDHVNVSPPHPLVLWGNPVLTPSVTGRAFMSVMNSMI